MENSHRQPSMILMAFTVLIFLLDMAPHLSCVEAGTPSCHRPPLRRLGLLHEGECAIEHAIDACGQS